MFSRLKRSRRSPALSENTFVEPDVSKATDTFVSQRWTNSPRSISFCGYASTRLHTNVGCSELIVQPISKKHSAMAPPLLLNFSMTPVVLFLFEVVSCQENPFYEVSIHVV